MRTINLRIHQQSMQHLSQQNEYLYNLYGKHESDAENKTTKLKEEEDLSILTKDLLSHLQENEQMHVCDGYYWNYTIPRIGKEFDLLRIGTNFLVNIEIKSISTEEKMKVQLEKNRKYLKILGRPVYLFSFSSSDSCLYTLEEDTFREASFEELIALLKKQKVDETSDIDAIFSPIQFLISPFNNTEKFLRDEYFLTTQQEKIFNDIIEFSTPYHEIVGRVGTGKSLLLYHIAKQLMMEDKYAHRVAIVHCGILNEGHRTLLKHGYRIYSLKEWINIQNQENIKVLCIDEFQRIHSDQMETILSIAQEKQMKVIFSVDPVQVFDMTIKEEAPYEKCKEKYGFVEHRVSDHIRSNPDISRFAKDVMDLREHHGRIPSENIRVHGTDAYPDARKMIDLYVEKGYCFINYTASYFQDSLLKEYQGEGDVHQMIGQEYDKVVTILDDAFFYNEEEMLDAVVRQDTMYLRPEMFYEAITRARMEIAIIVIHNPTVFTTLLTLFR